MNYKSMENIIFSLIKRIIIKALITVIIYFIHKIKNAYPFYIYNVCFYI